MQKYGKLVLEEEKALTRDFLIKVFGVRGWNIVSNNDKIEEKEMATAGSSIAC